jgi:hypothetical protein
MMNVFLLATGGWELAAGDWRLATGGLHEVE